jgi:hypothetical protein
MEMHNDIQDVWDYLTAKCGHARLWLKEKPIPTQHRISPVMIRYNYQPVIVSGSGRALAVLNLTKGVWEYTGITLKYLPQDLKWLTPPSEQEIDDELVQILSAFTGSGNSEDLR